MPILHRAKDGHYYVSHRFTAQEGDVARNYSLSDAGLMILNQAGISEETRFSQQTFFDLREAGHIFTQANNALPATTQPAIDLHRRVREFFRAFSEASSDRENAISQFKSIVLEVLHIPSNDTRKQMFIELGMRAKNLNALNIEGANVFPEFRNLLIRICPQSIVRDYKMIFEVDDDFVEKIRQSETIVPPPELDDPIPNTDIDAAARLSSLPASISDLKKAITECISEAALQGVTIEISIKISKPQTSIEGV